AFIVTINADYALFNAAVNEAKAIGDEFAGQTYTATLDADQQPHITQIASATQIGQTFAATTFTSKLNADSSLFTGALAGARAAGYAFAGTTFTATISANTSPFFNAIASINGRTVGTAYINVEQRTIGNLGGSFGKAHNGGLIKEPMTLVGENGPELVSLPYGSYVYPHVTSKRMISEWADSLHVPLANTIPSMTPSGSTGISPSQSNSLSVVVVKQTGSSGTEERPIQIIFSVPTYMRDEKETKQVIKEAVKQAKSELARDRQMAD